MKDDFLRNLDRDLRNNNISQSDYERLKTTIETYDEKLSSLLKDLESGKISRDAYATSYQKIASDIKALNTVRESLASNSIKMRKKKSENKVRKPIITALIAIAAILAVRGVAVYSYGHRSIDGIPEPVQNDLSSAAQSKTHVVHGEDIGRPYYEMEMNYLASYDIKGLVIGTKHFNDETIYDKSFPVDVSLGWGDLAANRGEIDCKNGPRKLSCTYSRKITQEKGRSISNMISNNHLSPATHDIYDKIRKIRAGDYVEIKGYLVHVRVKNVDGRGFEATSSLVRNDHMDGAFDRTNTGCEMIYVESVEWLD